MSPLHEALADYLKIRRALGYKLERAGKLLPQYLDYLDACGERLVTIENALAWATLPTGDQNWWAFRCPWCAGSRATCTRSSPPTKFRPRTCWRAKRGG